MNKHNHLQYNTMCNQPTTNRNPPIIIVTDKYIHIKGNARIINRARPGSSTEGQQLGIGNKQDKERMDESQEGRVQVQGSGFRYRDQVQRRDQDSELTGSGQGTRKIPRQSVCVLAGYL